MKKIVSLLLFVMSLGAFSQHTLKGTMDPPGNFNWIMLYQLQGAKQEYVANADITEGRFAFKLADSLQTGVYRLIYDLNQNLFVDVIYNKEDIAFTFNPNFPQNSISFQQSEENKIYQRYLNTIEQPQSKLDSLQVVYFSADSANKKNIQKLYAAYYAELMEVQQTNEVAAKGTLAEHFIKASARFNPTKPIESAQTYLVQLKSHFFDAIDFTDKVLLNSTFINDKINDFIFYLNSSDDPETNHQLQTEAITVVMDKIKANLSLSQDVQEGLLYAYSSVESTKLTRFILDNFYSKLPKTYQDHAFKTEIENKLKTSLGSIAPDIQWSTKSLMTLAPKEFYIIAFWSSSCSHCQIELPLLYDFLKNNDHTTVVAIGLEEASTKADWEQQILKYPGWEHIYGLGKWDYKYAKIYDIHATPTFFILDKDRRVIAKPDDVDELKAYFEELK
ncbi:hypothetical protein MWU59_03160 [Flavobacteriaceae bacterium F08102]|nr:hypothetical protein [Flavobacteriaceae bacterium F08102]